MSKKDKQKSKQKERPSRLNPWGKTSGLFAACVVTLVGVVRGLEPDVVLARAVVAALVIGITVAITNEVLHRSLTHS